MCMQYNYYIVCLQTLAHSYQEYISAKTKYMCMCLISWLNTCTGLPYKFSTRLLSMLGCTTFTLVASLTPGCPTTSLRSLTMELFSMNGELKPHDQYLLVMHSHDPHMHARTCTCMHTILRAHRAARCTCTWNCIYFLILYWTVHYCFASCIAY
jgi:hypothetical protein